MNRPFPLTFAALGPWMLLLSVLGLPHGAHAQECVFSEQRDFAVEGFGADTVGGWQPGHDTYCVTQLGDSGPGSLREATQTGGAPRVVAFAVDGEISLGSALALPSNISLDGRGRDVSVVGKGFLVHGQSQVILTHLAIRDVHPDSEDGVQIAALDGVPSHHVVLDHLTFSQSGDGGNSEFVDEAVSVVWGSHSVTVAWCHFQRWEKGLLLGNGDASADIDGAITVTVHHNYFEATGRRHPRGRYGHFDVYNNYLYDWRMYAPAGPPIWHQSYGIFCQDQCTMRVEENIFERHPHEYDIPSEAPRALKCETGGAVNDLGGWVVPGSAPLRFGVKCLPSDYQRPYPAQIDPADEALRQRLMTQTGHLGG